MDRCGSCVTTFDDWQSADWVVSRQVHRRVSIQSSGIPRHYPHLDLLLSADSPFRRGSHARLLLQARFAGQVLDAWAHQRGVKLHFIGPGKPVQYAFMESFNGHFPGECLNRHGFISLPDAQQKIEGLEAGLQPGSASSLTAESNPARIHRCRGGSPPPSRPGGKNNSEKPPWDSHYVWYRKRGCPRLSSSKSVDRRSVFERSSPSNKASPAGSCIHRSVSIVEWDEDLPSGGLRGE